MKFIEHVIAGGEDLFFLAEFYYGDAGTWWIIYHANAEVLGDDPEETPVGTVLRIPFLETSEETVEFPAVIPATAFALSKDPLIQYCEDRFADPFMVFDIREGNDLTDDGVVAAGTEIDLPPRGNPKNLRKARAYREKFHRRWAMQPGGGY